MEIRETVEARKVKISEDRAWDMLGRSEEIVVGRGAKFIVLHPSRHSRQEILDHCLGRTGTLRAPVLKIGKRFLVGFNRGMYESYLS